MLLVYGLAFMVILPVVVVSLPLFQTTSSPHSCPPSPGLLTSLCLAQGTWWYRSIRYSGDQILINTTQLFMHFMYKTPNMNMKREFYLPKLQRPLGATRDFGQIWPLYSFIEQCTERPDFIYLFIF